MSTLTRLPDPSVPLDAASAEAAFGDILDGRIDDGAIHDFLLGITLRDETATEIAAAASALRARMIRVRAPAGAILVSPPTTSGSTGLASAASSWLTYSEPSLPTAMPVTEVKPDHAFTMRPTGSSFVTRPSPGCSLTRPPT